MNSQNIDDVFRKVSSLENEMQNNIENAKQKSEKITQEEHIKCKKDLDETKTLIKSEIDTMINEAKEEAKKAVDDINSKTRSILDTVTKVDPQKIKKAKEIIINNVTGAVNA